MFNQDLKDKVNALEVWVENISNIQNQLLKELGYDIEYINPNYPPERLRLVKINKE